MDRDDIDLAIDWAAKEGWNPGIHDGGCFYYTDLHGFFIGELDGEPIGCISAVAYNDSFRVLGLYMVKSEYRGRGFGMKLWKTALKYMENRNIGLYGVIVQQEKYEKSGFQLAYRNIRYEGVGEGYTSQNIVELKEVPFGDLVAYDAALFSAQHPKFLRKWIHQPEGATLCFLNNGKLAGYGVIRACHNGFKIGPLFADEEQIAEELSNSLARKARILQKLMFQQLLWQKDMVCRWYLKRRECTPENLIQETPSRPGYDPVRWKKKRTMVSSYIERINL